MTAYYKAKLNKGGKEESNKKKQKQDASPLPGAQTTRQRGAKALCPVFPFLVLLPRLFSESLFCCVGQAGGKMEDRVGTWRSSLKKASRN